MTNSKCRKGPNSKTSTRSTRVLLHSRSTHVLLHSSCFSLSIWKRHAIFWPIMPWYVFFNPLMCVHVCICVWICVSLCVCVCMWWSKADMRRHPHSLSAAFTGAISPLNTDLLMLTWLPATVFREPVCASFDHCNYRWTDMPTWHLFWRSELQSSCLYSKCFITEPSPTPETTCLRYNGWHRLTIPQMTATLLL